MDDIYDDLENFNDVNIVNELRTENEELKQKLGKYADSMASLQKDFDNLSAEFKKLETNYSSLLKSARAEIKRKTDMIKNLNIEKDMLVLKQFQGKPDHRQKLMNVNKVKAEGNVKKKNNSNKAEDLKQREEFRKSPSENSSTATEKSNKLLSIDDRVRDSIKSTAINTSKDNETRQNENHRENCHDDRLQGGGCTDRRISTLTSQQFLKFSSDEEFEDLYSALEPKTSECTSFGDEAQKSQKRFRGEPQHTRVYNELSGPHGKRLNYTDIPRDRFNKKSNRRFYENERNMNRDKHDLPHPFRNKYSPDRGRYSKRDFGEDRFLQKYDRYRWRENSGERYQQKSRERRPYSDRGRSDQNLDMDMNKYSDTYTGKHKLASSSHIHGEYDQPPLKRFRGDQYPHTDQDRRRNDRQFPNEYPSSEMREAYPQTQNNDEFVNSIYADLDKPTSDSVMLPCEDSIKDNQDVNHDIGNERDVADTHDLHSTKKESNKSKVLNDKDNLISKHTEDKLNEGEKLHTITKYKIPLKGVKVNTDELSKTKSNEVHTLIHSDENTRPSLPHKDLPSVNDCIKISDVAETVNSSKLSSKANSKSLPAKISKTGKDETEGSTSFERALEHKLASIRNIVEGDLELSDETNDDTQAQLKENELPDTKKKHKVKKKSHKDISKNKTPTRKSRSKTDKDKDVKAKNKFSELFGDSSSLITPEDLELIPTPASTQSADAYAAVCEDAQDGIPLQDKPNNVRTLAAKKEIIGPEPNAICPQTDSLHLDEKNKMIDTKDNKSRGDHIKHRKSEVLLIDDVEDLKEINSSNIVNSSTVDGVKTTLMPEVEKTVSTERVKEQVDRNKPGKKVKNDVLETHLMPEVKTVPSYKKNKDTPKVTKLDKKTRCDSITPLLMPEVNTASTSDKSKEIYVNKPDQITKGNIVETYLISKVKPVASSEESTDIFNVSKPDKKAVRNVVETHLMPEVTAVASHQKSKEILNVSKPDKKTKSDVETHFMPEVEVVESSEKSEEVFNINKPNEKIKNDLEAHVIPGLRALASCETAKEIINITKSDNKKNHNVETPLMIEMKPTVSREKSKEIRNVTKPEKKTKGGALKSVDKNNDHKKSNKKPKSNEDKMFPSSEVEKESHITKNQSIAESNKPPIKSSNKENESCGEVSDGTMNSDLPTFFEDTLVPIENISIDKNKTDEEKSTVNMVPKESVGNTRIDNIPNLEAVKDDEGLVNTVVISSGVQPADTNVLLQVNTTENQYRSLMALATSTPTRELSTFNNLSEIKPYTTSSVNVKTPNGNLISKNDESDIPDVRIYCYRRRRKLVK